MSAALHDCPHDHVVRAQNLAALPRSQAEPVRHRCVACAFARGRELAGRLAAGELAAQLRRSAARCPHGFPVLLDELLTVPAFQGGSTRHLCAGCAFMLGVQVVRTPAPSLPFEPDPARRLAVERHAMALARKELRRAGCTAIEDRSATESYDYVCLHEGAWRMVEVKGTTGDGDGFLATAAEVSLARLTPGGTWLIVVHGIDFPPRATKPRGGQVRSVVRWTAEAATPTQFRCTTP